jgi:hypothetical protein
VIHDNGILSQRLIKRSLPENGATIQDVFFGGYHFVDLLLRHGIHRVDDAFEIFGRAGWMTPLRLRTGSPGAAPDRYRLAWEALQQEAKYFARFFDMPGQSLRKHLSEIEPVLRQLATTLSRGLQLFRSRLKVELTTGTEAEVARELGPPPLGKVKNNRMSPAGVSYMYLSADQLTAVNETRPEVGDDLCIGCFELVKDLHVVDLTGSVIIKQASLFSPEFTPDMKRRSDFVKEFSHAISRPTPSDATELSYVPTQLVCEYVRSLGYDGMSFRSSLSLSGDNVKKNFVLFCGPEQEKQSYAQLPAFSDWMRLVSCVNLNVCGVGYEFRIRAGAEGAGADRKFV